MRSHEFHSVVAGATVMLSGMAVSQNAAAADDMIAFGKETFKVNFGLYRPEVTTKVSESVTGGTKLPSISGETDLGLDKSINAARLDGFWRIADRHRLWAGYYKLDREGTKTLSNNIGPVNIPSRGTTDTILAGSSISTSSKLDLYLLGYGYSFYKTENVEIAGKLGLNVARSKVSLSGTLNTAANGSFFGSTSGTDVTVPLPVIAISGDWGINERWRLKGSLGGLKLKSADVKSSVSDVSAAVEYRLVKNFGVGAGYSALSASADVTKGNSSTSLDWQLRGWQLYGSFVF